MHNVEAKNRPTRSGAVDYLLHIYTHTYTQGLNWDLLCGGGGALWYLAYVYICVCVYIYIYIYIYILEVDRFIGFAN